MTVDPSATREILDQIAALSPEYFSLGEGGAEVQLEQACYLPTGSGDPVIGLVKKGIWVASGHGCWGICNGPFFEPPSGRRAFGKTDDPRWDRTGHGVVRRGDDPRWQGDVCQDRQAGALVDTYREAPVIGCRLDNGLLLLVRCKREGLAPTSSGTSIWSYPRGDAPLDLGS